MYPLGGITCYLLGFCVLLIKPHVFQNCGKQNKPFFFQVCLKPGICYCSLLWRDILNLISVLTVLFQPWCFLMVVFICIGLAGREIAPNTGANATKFFTLATKSWKLVAKLATRTFHYNLTKRYREFKKFAKITPRQISSLSLFPKRSTCISIDY